MKIFDDAERTTMEPAANSESTFAYLNRSARPEMAATRDLLEESRQVHHYSST